MGCLGMVYRYGSKCTCIPEPTQGAELSLSLTHTCMHVHTHTHTHTICTHCNIVFFDIPVQNTGSGVKYWYCYPYWYLAVYHTHITRMWINESDDKATLCCKTKGQSLVFKKIAAQRKLSLLANSPLKRKRAKLIAKIRQNVLGNSEDDSLRQHSSELKTKCMQEKLLQAAGIRRPVISSKQGSVLRTRLGLSWSTYRKHRKLLKDIGGRVNIRRENCRTAFSVGRSILYTSLWKIKTQ